jgi:hypothetical protein
MENETATHEAMFLDCPICKQRRVVFFPKEGVYITHAQVEWKCGRCKAELTSILEEKKNGKQDETEVGS